MTTTADTYRIESRARADAEIDERLRTVQMNDARQEVRLNEHDTKIDSLVTTVAGLAVMVKYQSIIALALSLSAFVGVVYLLVKVF